MYKAMLQAILTFTLFVFACGVLYGAGREEGPDPEPGVALDLARWRAAHYSNVRYGLSVEVAPGAPLMKGAVEIRVNLDGGADKIILDWRPAPAKENQPPARAWGVSVNGSRAEGVRQVNDHIVITGAHLRRGENVVHIQFESPIATSGSAVTRYLDREDNSEYVYTLFVPSDASTAFPCFDQPDLKARFTLDITAPEWWKVISNTQEETIEIYEGASTKRTRFRETQPISTYLFAFAAGPFVEFENSELASRDKSAAYPPIKSVEEVKQLMQNAEPSIRVFVRRSKAERARQELSEIFRLNRECLAFLAKYFDYKFPFPKYDLIVIPEFAYGGMEHAGATFLREERILFPTDPTASDFLSRAEIMFHEAAHQWFGDLVTMRWFDDLWLKEGFATFMAYKTIEAVMPQYDAWKVFYQRTKPGAYVTDVTKGTTPIWQRLANLSAAKSAYGNIVYLKAPSILKQAEFFLGPEEFRRAVRSFVKEHAFANAEWGDLVRSFSRSSGKKLDEWAAAWVGRRGLADVRIIWSTDGNNRIDSFTLRQEDVLREGGAWPMRVKILLAYDDAAPETLTVMISGNGEARVSEAIGKRRPAYVFANYEDYGYGRFLLDRESERAVLNQLGGVRDDFLRALLWGALWESVREAELAPSDYIELAIKLLPDERDEVAAQSILSRASTAFNRYLSGAQMKEIAPRLENVLADRMTKAETPGLRITYFRAFQSIATTNAARSTLKKIFRGNLKIPGMTLRPRDRFDIVTIFLARDDPEAPALLETQRAADATDDGKRYAYAAGAARAKAAVKNTYFDAYLNDTKLPESWIEASLNPFNTIRQSELTLPFLERALVALPQLKRTRKIFFVNNWLAAFIGGQCDARARNTVSNFLARGQSLDRDLRLKVLEAADGLDRCVRIRAKYTEGETRPKSKVSSPKSKR